jgi:hypothetical protein
MAGLDDIPAKGAPTSVCAAEQGRAAGPQLFDQVEHQSTTAPRILGFGKPLPGRN